MISLANLMGMQVLFINLRCHEAELVKGQLSGSGVCALDVLGVAASEVFRSKRGNYHGFRKRV